MAEAALTGAPVGLGQTVREIAAGTRIRATFDISNLSRDAKIAAYNTVQERAASFHWVDSDRRWGISPLVDGEPKETEDPDQVAGILLEWNAPPNQSVSMYQERLNSLRDEIGAASVNLQVPSEAVTEREVNGDGGSGSGSDVPVHQGDTQTITAETSGMSFWGWAAVIGGVAVGAGILGWGIYRISQRR